MESLAKHHMATLNEARGTYSFRNFWTSDSKISLKMKKILQANPLPTMINICDK